MVGPGPPGLEPQENAAYYLILKGGANNEFRVFSKIRKSNDFKRFREFSEYKEIK